jgi:DNA-binding GntR family transcriptional regulator
MAVRSHGTPPKTRKGAAAPPIRTVREQITDRLRNAILSGRFTAGQRLKEVELAGEFGVSRGPVRDALLQLTKEGILEYRPNCGVEVAPTAGDDVRPLLVALRRQIEAHALRAVVPTLTRADLEEWRAILERLRQACAADDIAAVVEHDMAFHRWVIDRIGDADLAGIWLPITMRMRLVYSRHRSLNDVYPEHARVWRAARRGDVDAAVRAMEANIR